MSRPLADPYPLRPTTRRALRALVAGLCPPEPAPDLDLIEDRLRRWMRYMHPLFAKSLISSIHLLDWAPVWWFGRARRMRNLGRDEIERLLERMSVSRFAWVRMLMLGLRSLVFAIYFDEANVHRELDYDPVPWMQARTELRRSLIA